MRTKPKAVSFFLWLFAFGLAQQANGEPVVDEGLTVQYLAASGGSMTWVDPSTKTIYIMLQNAWGGDKNLTHSTFLNTASKAIPPK